MNNMKIIDVINILESKFPKSLKESWDNVGLLAGDENSEVRKILVTLDVTLDVIDEAIEKGANLIISHHPLMLRPVNDVVENKVIGKKLRKLIKSDISVYSMHTNLDISVDGLNDYVAEILEFRDVKPILDKEDMLPARLCSVKEGIKIKDLAIFVKEKLGIDIIRYVSCDDEKIINKLVLCTGSGKSFIDLVKNYNADCLLTGDITYHTYLDAYEDDICVIDASHYYTEVVVIDLLENFLKDKVDIEIIKSTKNKNIIKSI